MGYQVTICYRIKERLPRGIATEEDRRKGSFAKGREASLYYDLELSFPPSVGMELHAEAWHCILSKVAYNVEHGTFKSWTEQVPVLEDYDPANPEDIEDTFQHEVDLLCRLGWRVSQR